MAVTPQVVTYKVALRTFQVIGKDRMPGSPVRPPYRAEHVGSFPRPERLLKAREEHASGTLPRDELKRIERECIRDVVAMQERVGIGAITDGEYPKTGWREFLFEKCEGFEGECVDYPYAFTRLDGTQWKPQGAAGVPKATRKVRRREVLSADDYDVLRTMTQRPIKANLPTPSIAHMAGDESFDRSVYPDRDAYLADVVSVLREEIADLAARGCAYLQMDEVPLAVLCDPKNRETLRQRGEDPDRVIESYIDAINEAVNDRPREMTIAVHMCRGNADHGMGSGGYDAFAERMFGRLDVDGYFLEYDTPRAGDFTPLRFIPKGKKAVLGLVSTKLPEVEPADLLRRRIDEAARAKHVEDLCLAPQCGFSSVAANRSRFNMDLVEAKLARIVEVADQFWG